MSIKQRAATLHTAYGYHLIFNHSIKIHYDEKVKSMHRHNQRAFSPFLLMRILFCMPYFHYTDTCDKIMQNN